MEVLKRILDEITDKKIKEVIDYYDSVELLENIAILRNSDATGNWFKDLENMFSRENLMLYGINKIEGNIRLNLDTLTSMLIIRPYGPSHYYQYELRLPRANFLFILLNLTRTDPGVEENLLYIGTNPHVQDDGGNEEEEGAHLHDDPVHHEQEVGGQYNDERWAWMQTEIQRISTEQQRQGVEISGLRNDVQRANRMPEENNQMLLRMMQHLHLQGPPYRPQ